MDVQITFRHMRTGEALRALAEQKAARLERYEPRLIRVEVLFDEDGGEVRAETRAFVPGLPTLVASSRGETPRKALDSVIGKARRQLRKERSRRVEHQAPPTAALVE